MKGEPLSDTELILMQEESRFRHPEKRKPYKKRKPKVILPDLMAEMVKNTPTKPQEAQESPQTQIPIPTHTTEKKVWFAPKTKQIEKWARPISRVPILPDEPRTPITRVPARYDNISSPYGLWTEIAKEQLKKIG